MGERKWLKLHARKFYFPAGVETARPALYQSCTGLCAGRSQRRMSYVGDGDEKAAREMAMKRDAWERWLVISGAVGALLLPAFASSAHADAEEVARRLDKYGKLSSGEARKLVSSVSSRMKRAADMTSANDPVRQAVAVALGSANANDAMTAAKIRLRLYAGLNEWALDNLFAPRPGAMATCTGQFGLRGKACDGLMRPDAASSASQSLPRRPN